MPFVSPGSVTAGNVAPASWGNGVVAYLLNLANPPACRVYHNTTQASTTAVNLTVAFNSERWDTDSMHDTVTNNNRITVKTAGLYVVGLCLEIALNATGTRNVGIRLNGTTFLAQTALPGSAADAHRITLTTVWKAAVNDFFDVNVFQNSGSSLNIISSGNYTPEFFATWVGLG